MDHTSKATKESTAFKHRFPEFMSYSKAVNRMISQFGSALDYLPNSRKFVISIDSTVTGPLTDKLDAIERTMLKRSTRDIPPIHSDSADKHNMSIDTANNDTTTESNNTSIAPITPITPTPITSKRQKIEARSRSVRARYKRYTAKSAKQKARDQVDVINFIKEVTLVRYAPS